jgi:hypothetical protein
MESAVSVLDISLDPKKPQERYLEQSTTSTALHPIAHTALTEPKISSIDVVVEDLEDWAGHWHAFLFCKLGEELGDRASIPPDHEVPSSYMPKYDDEDMEPPPGPTLRVTSSSEKGYVTIHDYLSAIHPWLLGLRENILWARNCGGGSPLPPETKLTVFLCSPDPNIIYLEDE